MRRLLILALLVSILIGTMLPAMVIGGNNAIVTQTQIAEISDDNNAVVTQTQIAETLDNNNAVVPQTQIAEASDDDNAVVTQTYIIMVLGGNNADQYANTTIIPEFGPDMWYKWYDTVYKKVNQEYYFRVPAGSTG